MEDKDWWRERSRRVIGGRREVGTDGKKRWGDGAGDVGVGDWDGVGL